MQIDMLYSKIHRACVTDANLNYVGSITIDSELMKKAKLYSGQKVEIVNINNGARFSTYVIKGKKGNRDICINGAAARLVQTGDRVIIIAYASMSIKELKKFKPYVLLVDENNNIEKINRCLMV